ncbi:MAG: hypothetical protein ACD_78C00413G0002 [uncultured bacterium (gcode 4)]|uniref:Uncharacterized protein n=1 Tax=uncultured bacterium (gcode 4) TaxID=1234023 RepID=K1YAI6_9BACT|nr:MAG: hypothetical protein ACD_78C00413G0002 [uncultured bacterium (gcode 4)]
MFSANRQEETDILKSRTTQKGQCFDNERIDCPHSFNRETGKCPIGNCVLKSAQNIVGILWSKNT